MQPNELFEFYKYIPNGTLPFLVSEDGKENCGYSTESRFTLIYYHPLNDYLSIDYITKKSNIIIVPDTNQRIWVVDLQHYLKSMLEGNYDYSYFLHPENKNRYQFYPQTEPEFISKWNLFINNCNSYNVFNSAMELLDVFKKNYNTNSKKLLPNLLHSFRAMLYAERILRNDLFPNPNIFELKKNHRYESIIDELLRIDATGDILQSFQYHKSLEIIERCKYELHALKEDFHRKCNIDELIQQGNDVFLHILQIE